MAAGPTHLTKQLRNVPRDTKNRSGLLTDVTLLGPIRDVIKTEASPERFLLWKMEFLGFLNPVKICDYCTCCKLNSSIAYKVRVRRNEYKEAINASDTSCRADCATVADFPWFSSVPPDKCQDNT
jgi:hypothetical protein